MNGLTSVMKMAQALNRSDDIPKWQAQLDTNVDRFKKSWQIAGQGAFGTAFIATLNAPCPSQSVVIKIQNAQGNLQQWKKEIILPELTAMKTLGGLPYPSSGYFVGLLDDGYGPAMNQHSMLLELANKGTLTSVMFQRGQPVRMDQQTIGRMLHQMISGLKVLASQGLVHRDIKPDNILVVKDDASQQLHAKIADFGLAREFTAPPEPLTTTVVTLWYRAPELLLGAKRYGTAVDMWSVGCILCEIIGRKAIFNGRDHLDQIKKILSVIGTPTEADLEWIPAKSGRRFLARLPTFERQPWATLYPKVSASAHEAIDKMLLFDPTKRLEFDIWEAQLLVKLFLPQDGFYPKGFDGPLIYPGGRLMVKVEVTLPKTVADAKDMVLSTFGEEARNAQKNAEMKARKTPSDGDQKIKSAAGKKDE